MGCGIQGIPRNICCVCRPVSVFMSFGNKLINTYFPLPGGDCYEQYFFHPVYQLPGNLLYPENTGKKREGQPFIRYLLLMSVPVVSSILIVLTILSTGLTTVSTAIMAFVPSLLFCEGSFAFVPAWRGLYFCLDSKRSFPCFIRCSVCLSYSRATAQEGLLSVSPRDIQWMMIFALPVILLYNKQRCGDEVFFYIFYPAHIYLLPYLLFTAPAGSFPPDAAAVLLSILIVRPGRRGTPPCRGYSSSSLSINARPLGLSHPVNAFTAAIHGGIHIFVNHSSSSASRSRLIPSYSPSLWIRLCSSPASSVR